MSWLAAETLATGPTFEGRTGHTSVYDPVSGRIFVFGGSKNKKWFNDVHILDTHSWRWTMVEVCVSVSVSVCVCVPGSIAPVTIAQFILFMFLLIVVLFFC